MKSKSTAVNRARQFARIIGTSLCATRGRVASQIVLRGTQAAGLSLPAACRQALNGRLRGNLESSRQAAERSTQQRVLPKENTNRLLLCRLNGDGFARCSLLLLWRVFSCDLPDLA